jgi:hypothetical protein
MGFKGADAFDFTMNQAPIPIKIKTTTQSSTRMAFMAFMAFITCCLFTHLSLRFHRFFPF